MKNTTKEYLPLFILFGLITIVGGILYDSSFHKIGIILIVLGFILLYAVRESFHKNIREANIKVSMEDRLNEINNYISFVNSRSFKGSKEEKKIELDTATEERNILLQVMGRN